MSRVRYTARARLDLLESPYLILYRVVPEGIQVVRVLHGARHIDRRLFAAGIE